MVKNELYSFKDLHGQVFTDEPAENFSGDIEGSNFQQDQPNTEVFPPGATGNLLACNLNNCSIPPGMTVGSSRSIASVNIQHKQMNDLEHWVVDSGTLEPIEPFGKEVFVELGISIDPADIPVSKLDEPITVTQREAT
jgi:hypothetical protein